MWYEPEREEKKTNEKKKGEKEKMERRSALVEGKEGHEQGSS